MVKRKVTVVNNKKKKYELEFMEQESPTMIEYAVNCSPINYTHELLAEMSKKGIAIEEVVSVTYQENVEKYEPGQGKKIENRL